MTLRFHVLGDSLAAGVGCTRRTDTLGHLLAERLRTADRTVGLHVHAVPDARSAGLTTQVRRAVAAGVVRAGGIIAPMSRDVTARFAADHTLFSGDRFHPSPAGYRLVADALAPHVLAAAQLSTPATS